MKKEKKLKLNMIAGMQMRTLILAFFAFCSAMVAAGAVVEGADVIKTAREFNKDGKLAREDRHDITGDAVFLVAAFAVLTAIYGAGRATKRQNDVAAIRVARRFMMDMRKQNPVFKRYDYILNNGMALHNIAAGIANRLSPAEMLAIGGEWDTLRMLSEQVNPGSVEELRIKNNAIQSVANILKEHAERDPHFMGALVRLVDDSAKTFALRKYMQQQMSR